MNKVTTLPISLAQPPESKGDGSILSGESKGRADNFSQVLSQNTTVKSRGNEVTQLAAQKNAMAQQEEQKKILPTNANEADKVLTVGAGENEIEKQDQGQLTSNAQDAINESSISESETNNDAAQTEQLLLILQNSDKALIVEQNKAKLASNSNADIQENSRAVHQTLVDAEQDQIKTTVNNSQDNVFQQAKMIVAKAGEPIDPNTGKNWKGGIELPVEPPAATEKINQVLAVDEGVAQTQITDEQAGAIKAALLAQEDKLQSTRVDNSLPPLLANKDSRVLPLDSGKADLALLAANAQEKAHLSNDNKDKKLEVNRVSESVVNINALAFNQKNNTTDEKKSLSQLSDNLITAAKNNDNDSDIIDDVIADPSLKQGLNATEQRMEQVVYSTLGNQGVNNINNYSAEQLQDIQALQATGDKIIDTNNQNQKIELTKQIETIAIYKKDFVNNLQDKVLVMVQQKLQQVDIRLDPPELGQMQVKLHLHNDQASIQFIVQNQQAKDALDQNIPRLREMLAGQGVALGDTNVGQQGEQGFMGTNEQNNNHAFNNRNEEDYIDASQVFTSKMVKGSATGIDYYA